MLLAGKSGFSTRRLRLSGLSGLKVNCVKLFSANGGLIIRKCCNCLLKSNSNGLGAAYGVVVLIIPGKGGTVACGADGGNSDQTSSERTTNRTLLDFFPVDQLDLHVAPLAPDNVLGLHVEIDTNQRIPVTVVHYSANVVRLNVNVQNTAIHSHV